MMKSLFCSCFILAMCMSFSSCQSDNEEYKREISNLEDRVSELESELEEANNTISEYEAKFDQIQSDAPDGYDAISYFNWSYELQEALDAFENIQSEASY